MNSQNPYFTVFTPTYNRAHTLSGVYESLCSQIFTDLEWIIVDDGSVDNTEKLVNKRINVKRIPIRYFKTTNQGKHVAHNLAVDNAQGLLFLFLIRMIAVLMMLLRHSNTIGKTYHYQNVLSFQPCRCYV